MKYQKIDFNRIDNDEFYNLVENTTKDWVLEQCLENATPEQCEYLAEFGEIDKITMMFVQKLLPIATPEQCKFLAEFGKTNEIAMMFAKKLLPNATYNKCKHLTKCGKTDKIKQMFKNKLKELDEKEEPYYKQFL